MSLTERSRAVLHRRLAPLIDDEEATGEMVSSLATDTTGLATKEQLSTVEANLRAEVATAVNQLTFRFIGANIALMGFVLAIVGLR